MPNNEVDNLEWLEAWYHRQCDGVWENELGMNLRPVQPAPRSQAPQLRQEEAPHRATNGWGLTIELAGTDAADHQPRTLVLDSTDGDWLSCAMTPDRFEGSGDAGRLEQIIGVFRHWVDTNTSVGRLRLAVTAGD
jgi:hypothetical protein